MLLERLFTSNGCSHRSATGISPLAELKPSFSLECLHDLRTRKRAASPNNPGPEDLCASSVCSVSLWFRFLGHHGDTENMEDAQRSPSGWRAGPPR